LVADSELLTASEVGERLRLPLSTVYYLAKEGKLRGFRIGRAWRFPVTEIHRLREVQAPRVLIVDDHPPTRELVALSLEPRGCRVEQCSTARQAHIMAQRTRYDVLFVGMKLPDCEGIDLIRELEGAYKLEQMVLISTLLELPESAALDGMGEVALLPKPLSSHGLASCVERITGQHLPDERHGEYGRQP
jgi:excisionase family DNA binding protein